jgi:hypothetical protein
MRLFRKEPTVERWIEQEVDTQIRLAVLAVTREGIAPLSQSYKAIARYGRRGIAQLVEVIGITGPQDTDAAVAVASEMDLDEALEGLFGYLLRSNALWGRYRKFYEPGSSDSGHFTATRFDTTARVAAIDCLIALVPRVPLDSDWRPAFERVAREYPGKSEDSNLVWSANALRKALQTP